MIAPHVEHVERLDDDEYVSLTFALEDDGELSLVLIEVVAGGVQETRFPMRRAELASATISAGIMMAHLLTGSTPECPECGATPSYLECEPRRSDGDDD